MLALSRRSSKSDHLDLGPESAPAQRAWIEPRPITLDRPVEAKIVLDHGVRPDRYLARIGQIELVKDDLVAPDLAKEILEDLNGQLFSGTPSVSKAERREAGIVANRMVRPVDNPENSAETTIGDVGLASILDLEIGDLERTLCEADLPAFIIVDLRAGGNAEDICDGSNAFGSFQCTGSRLVLVCGVLM